MHVVITTIFPPTKGARALSERLAETGGTLWVVGDVNGPQSYDLPATQFLPITDQRRASFQLAALLPEKHYARKNLGYLHAIQHEPDFLVETDDDNIPTEEFWKEPARHNRARISGNADSWVNVYRAFTKGEIWPRGFPLENIRDGALEISDELALEESLVQQGLANGDPDVDAIYRMTRSLPFQFENAPPVSINRKSWCPFNSQNTTFFREAFPLLYLPSYCSFRMTDIWRSFVAQRCLWEMESTVLFTAPTVFQERNEHNLRRDFEQEIPGYLENVRICGALGKLSLSKGRDVRTTCDNLRTCYEALVSLGVIESRELALIQAWITDMLSAAQI